MKKLLIVSALMFLVVGCASRSTQCKYPIERDLTVSWEERQYWCAPSEYKNAPVQKPQYVELESSQQNAFTQYNINTSTFSSGIIRFYRHDNQYSKEDLQNILVVNKGIKLRGCRLTNESQQLNFGRALHIKNDLQRLGFNHKITILSDNRCIGSQSVEVK